MVVKQRAEPLSPDARRQTIVDAVIPLLLEDGPKVTTARIAAAAGIAEGTIFRVFPDKATLLFEAVRESFDPAPELDMLTRVEKELPFEIKLRKAAAILVKRGERVHALAAALRSMQPPPGLSLHDAHKRIVEANSLLFGAITRLFQESSSALAVEPAKAAAALRGLLFAVSFPLNDPNEMITSDEAVTILLDGVMAEGRV
jgi:AcrR family transcriptional regulator